jgi:hypothetical protein
MEVFSIMIGVAMLAVVGDGSGVGFALADLDGFIVALGEADRFWEGDARETVWVVLGFVGLMIGLTVGLKIGLTVGGEGIRALRTNLKDVNFGKRRKKELIPEFVHNSYVPYRTIHWTSNFAEKGC